MTSVFHCLSTEKLISLIGVAYLEDIKKIAFSPNLGDKHALVSCLIAKHYGNPILDSIVRKALFETIPVADLTNLAERYCKRAFKTRKNNALALSTIRWNSSHSDLIADVSSFLSLDETDMPQDLDSKLKRVIVEPVDNLPPVFDYQQDLIDSILTMIEKKERKFLLQLPTGAGKTRVLIEALVSYIKSTDCFSNGRNILWLAHSEELCEQSLETCEHVWSHKGNSNLCIARLWGSYNHNILEIRNHFIFATLQKLYSLMKRCDPLYAFIKRNIDIVIIDEAHKSLAPTYKSLLKDLSKNSTLIGATATPGRNSDASDNLRLARFFNKNLLTSTFPTNPITYLRQKGILSRLEQHFIETDIDVFLSDFQIDNDNFQLESSSKIMSLLANSKERNRIIIESVINEVRNNSPCIVFSCSVAHSLLLSCAFALSGFKARHIDCNMNKGNRRGAINSFKKGEYDILINYGILSTGFDSPRIKTVVITRPTNSIILYSQMIGRGLRGPAIGGSTTCKLIDIKDNFVNYGNVEKVYNFFDDYWK